MNTHNIAAQSAQLPARMSRPPLVHLVLYILVVWLALASFQGAEISFAKFGEGIPYLWELLTEMFPPDLSRIGPIGAALWQTFQMAVVGTILGILVSVPLGICASRVHSPHPLVFYCARGLISFFRTVPDLIWALIFIVSVGLGPFAGTLALMIDTMGFAGRFFAEAMEEQDSGPQEALAALGAGRLSIIFCAVFPGALPSMVNSALFCLEKCTRSSVVLGLVGAGGIGIELKVSMDTFRYDEAATMILLIFALVVVVEQLSGGIRRRIMSQTA